MRLAKSILVLLLVFSTPALALSTMRVPAIDADQQGLLTEISVSAVRGTGKISVDISPLISLDTQESIKAAAQVAARLANKSLSDYDLHVSINADASSVDGPSGGAAITMLAYAELSRQRLRPDATISAAVAPDGRLSNVGGIKEKLDAALEDGITLLVVAKGQSVGDDFDYVVYADQASNGSLQVVEAAEAEEAAAYLATAPGSRIAGAPSQGIPPLSVQSVSPSEASAPLRKLAEDEITVLNQSYADFLAGLAGSGTNLTAVVGSDAAAQAIERSIQKAQENARMLVDAGYYYSAANTAFLASVTIESLASRGKTEEQFGEALDELWDEIDSTEFIAKTTANLEWVAAAELRYHWAKWKLQAVEESLEAGSSVQSLAGEYAAAKVWLEAANRMNELAAGIAGGSAVTELNARNHARRLLDEAGAIEEDEQLAGDSEIQWHLAAARQECAEAAYVACSIDSRFVLSYAEALEQAENKTSRQLNRLLESGANLSDYSDSPWAEAYFIHSLYNAQENNRTGDASYLVSALKLQLLAAALKQNTEDLLRELASPTPYEPSPAPSEAPSATPAPSPSAPVVVVSATRPSGGDTANLLLAFAAIIAGVLVLALVLARVTARKPGPRFSAEQALERLDETLLEGRISERTYERLRAKYSARTPGEKRLRRKPRRR
ncbi:MAG: S16 family serine protease [Candidatus Micrarchaeota archaeon]